MSRAPLVFGFPAWIGLTKRVGKTHLTRERDFRHRILVDWRDGKIGDLYSDCSGFNHRLAAVDPAYRRVGRGKGEVLMDLDFIAKDGSSCSFFHCGVDLPISFEEAERWRQWLVRKALAEGDHQRARIWSPEVTTVHPDGTFSIDSTAYLRVRDEDTGPCRPGRLAR